MRRAPQHTRGRAVHLGAPWVCPYRVAHSASPLRAKQPSTGLPRRRVEVATISGGNERRRYESDTRRSRCMTGAVRGGRLPLRRAEVALRPCGPAHRRSDARARPAPMAAAPPRATDVRPPADPACRHTRASRRGPCRSPRRVARRGAARADPGVLILKPDRLPHRFGKLTRLRLTAGIGSGRPIEHAYGESARPVSELRAIPSSPTHS